MRFLLWGLFMRDCLYKSPPIVTIHDEKPINWKCLNDLGSEKISPLGLPGIETKKDDAGNIQNHANE